MRVDDDLCPRSDLQEEFASCEFCDSLKLPYTLTQKIQQAADGIINKCLDVDWNEDYLSLQLINIIRFILGSCVIENGQSNIPVQKFNVEAYKLTGQAEQSHGDIAVVITRSIAGEQLVSGVGFYEAKASGAIGDNYPSFSIQQMRRLVSSTPKLTYLLYNKNLQKLNNEEWANWDDSLGLDRGLRNFTYAHTNTVDANFLKQCRDLKLASRIMGQSFGYHFVYRIMSGRDLDYSRPPLDAIRRWLKSTRRSNPFVVSIAIQEKEDIFVSGQLDLPGFEEIQPISLPYTSILKIGNYS